MILKFIGKIYQSSTVQSCRNVFSHANFIFNICLVWKIC